MIYRKLCQVHAEVKENRERQKRIELSLGLKLEETTSFYFKPCASETEYSELKENLKDADFRRNIVGFTLIVLISFLTSFLFVIKDFSSFFCLRCNRGRNGASLRRLFADNSDATKIQSAWSSER